MPRDTEAHEEARRAGAKAQRAAEAFVHGAADPSTVLHRRHGAKPAPAGVYELTALEWNEPKRDEHGRRYNVKHRRGDLVELSADDADRLLRAGLVRPTSSDQDESDAAQEKSPFEKAEDYQREHGPVPAGSEGDVVEGDRPAAAPNFGS